MLGNKIAIKASAYRNLPEAAALAAFQKALAAPARPGEEVGVVDPVARERGPQRLGDVFLADDLGERLGPVAAIEGER